MVLNMIKKYKTFTNYKFLITFNKYYDGNGNTTEKYKFFFQRSGIILN